LEAIHQETRNQKAAKKGISARLMTDVTRHVPASTQLLAARLLMTSELAGRLTNVCISNVPGPNVPVYMNGAQLLGGVGLGPLGDRMGLFIAVASFNGNMSFNVTSCRRTLPDIEFFIECLRESFEELSEAAKLAKIAVTKKISVVKKTKAPTKNNVSKNKVSKKKASKKAV
jgi:diacylglycerol O-acyltransferase